MPRRDKFAAYSQLYDRLESTFSVEDLTQEAIESYLIGGKTVGRQTHTVKWGKDKKGKQRFKSITTGLTGSGLSNLSSLAERISLSNKAYERIKDIQVPKEISDFDGEDLDELETIEENAKTFDVHSSAVLKEVKPKVKSLKVFEQKAIVMQEGVAEFEQEVERYESLTDDELKRLFKEGNSEEREMAELALSRELPKVLGGLKSGETRRVPKAFRSLFEI